MGVLCVTYDLGLESTRDYPGLLACIRGLGPHRRITRSTWLVDTEQTPGEVVNALDAFNGDGDKIIVFPVAVGQKWSMLCGRYANDAETVAWLRQHVRR